MIVEELDKDIEVVDLEKDNLLDGLPDDLKKKLQEADLSKKEENLSEILEEKIETVVKEEYKIDRTLISQSEDETEVRLPDNRIVHIRKWKIKDKKNFDNSKNWLEAKTALVYNCVAEDIALDQEEFNFLLFKIRELSVHDKMKFTFICPECNSEEKLELDLSKLITTKGGEYSDIVSGENTFKMGAITNKDLYEAFNNSDVSEFNLFINDFIFHIKELNGRKIESDKDYAEVADFIANLDADFANDIFNQWLKMRFTLVFDNVIECKKCGAKNVENFSTLPEFFPESWRVVENI